MPRDNFTNSDYYEMILCVGATDGNLSDGRRLYNERFCVGRPGAHSDLYKLYVKTDSQTSKFFVTQY